MGKTIIQTIGPLYGESVNGTVFGRPNGSVFVPASNTISISIPAGTTISLQTNRYRVSADLLAIAESQDLASNVMIEVYSDSDLTTQVGTARSLPAGNFNGPWSIISYGTTEIVADEPYYIVAKLVNNGVPVAASNVLEVVGK